MKKHAGITLIELMIVIAILAIVAGMAAPSFNQLIRSNRVSTATNELLAAMQLARAEAIKLRRQVIVCRRNAGGTACEGNADWSAGWLVEGPNGVIRVLGSAPGRARPCRPCRRCNLRARWKGRRGGESHRIVGQHFAHG